MDNSLHEGDKGGEVDYYKPKTPRLVQTEAPSPKYGVNRERASGEFESAHRLPECSLP